MRPSFLPDGRRFLFVSVRETAPGAQDLYIGSLDGGDPALVLSGALRAAYVPPGYLVFNRGAMVMAQSFDPDRRVLSGEPVRVVDAVAMGPSGLLAGFSASASGVLAYAPGTATGEALSRLTWYSRDGRSMGTVGGPANYGDVAIAPDGKRIAVHLHEASPGGNLWLWDSSRSNFSQFTFDRSHNIVPLWSPDGTSIVFASDRGGSIFNLYRKAASGATPEELLLESKINKIPEAWTAHHGGLVLFASGGPAVSDWTIWRLPLSGERTATQISPGMSEFLSEFSPDGRWVAYVATQAGGLSTFQVYVRSYPGLNGPWRISTNGGNHPRWSADGRELYYLNPQGTEIMAAAITTDGTSLAAATPRAIIKTRVRQDHYPGGVPYDVTRDGRFLVNEFVAPEPSSGAVSDASSFTVVLNFTSGL
jgi:dipeptidyl aminopeptidase/acylaminoacyl peptidase